ncbi:MAG: TetR family transcriptional regulator [Hyphomonadaceae bacterium]|nr:TetR family transcriptional regulator [Hyphomonadaceae bacterium]
MDSVSVSSPQDGARLESRRTRILDAAEKLFAEHGYDGVTLRAIAREADVDVALANYHFGRKHELFEATFMRRAELLNRWRIRALDEAIASAAPEAPSVRAIMDAYLYPLLHGPHLSDPAWRSYYALVAYVNNSTEWGGKLMSRFFNPMVDRFIDALRKALPNAPEEALFWGYHCLSGALTLAFAQTGRLDKLSGGVCSSEDLEAAYTHIVAFVTAGFEQINLSVE